MGTNGASSDTFYVDIRLLVWPIAAPTEHCSSPTNLRQRAGVSGVFVEL